MEIESVRVKIEDCRHCNASPTQEEVRAAVRQAQKHRSCGQFRCAACGETVKAVSYELHHEGDAWRAYEREIEPAITLRIQPQNAPEVHDNNELHLRCVPKALPYVNGLDQVK